MYLRPTTSTLEHSDRQPNSWESMAMGVESLFIGRFRGLVGCYISSGEQDKQIGNNNIESRSHLLYAGAKLKKRSERYRRSRTVPT